MRGTFQQVLNWVRNQPWAAQCLAVRPTLPGIAVELLRHAKPWPRNSCPDFDLQNFAVFCDGSVFWQDQPSCTLSGAAAILVDKEGEVQRVLAAEPLPGLDHNSYRAEAYGIIFTLQKICRPTIYSDCQSAVDHLKDLYS